MKPQVEAESALSLIPGNTVRERVIHLFYRTLNLNPNPTPPLTLTRCASVSYTWSTVASSPRPTCSRASQLLLPPSTSRSVPSSASDSSAAGSARRARSTAWQGRHCREPQSACEDGLPVRIYVHHVHVHVPCIHRMHTGVHGVYATYMQRELSLLQNNGVFILRTGTVHYKTCRANKI